MPWPHKDLQTAVGSKIAKKRLEQKRGARQKVSSPGLLCYQGLCYNFAGIVPMGTHPVCAILKYAKIPQKIMQNTPSAIIGMEIALNCGGNMRATSTGIPKRHVKLTIA